MKDFILVRREISLRVILLIIRLLLRIVNLVVVVVSIIIRNNVVTSEIDCVGASNLEENVLILGNGDVDWLLVVLYRC